MPEPKVLLPIEEQALAAALADFDAACDIVAARWEQMLAGSAARDLTNPYHDELGRFTNRAGAGKAKMISYTDDTVRIVVDTPSAFTGALVDASNLEPANFVDVGEDRRAALIETLSASQIPLAHVRDLHFSTQPPAWPPSTLTESGTFHDTEGGGDYFGIYDPETKTVHVAPSLADSPTLLAHEIGHHVTMRPYPSPDARLGVAYQEEADAGKRKALEEYRSQLSAIGLRPYSTQRKEFWADSYCVMHWGSEAQRTKLARAALHTLPGETDEGVRQRFAYQLEFGHAFPPGYSFPGWNLAESDLGNPYHDAQGKFTDKAGAVGPASTRGAVSGSGIVRSTDYYDQPAEFPTIKRMLDAGVSFRSKQLADVLYGYAAVPEENGHSSQDREMLSFQHDIGFDGLPDVVSKAELDQYITAGEVELFRGVGGRPAEQLQHAEQLRSGQLYSGSGSMGSGTYTSTARDTAESYGMHRPEGVVRMCLKRDAKVMDFEAAAAGREFWSEAQIERFERLAEQPGGISERLTLERHLVRAFSRDIGRWSLMRGYDAIRVHELFGEDHYVILNRTALRVEAA